MFELRSLPNDVDVFVCNLPFYRQKIEEDVRLLDDLDVEVRAENVFDNSGVQNPGGQLDTDVFNFDDRVSVAHIVEESHVRVNLSNSGQPHGQRGRAEVLEGQLETVLVEGHGRRAVAAFFDRAPEKIGDLTRRLLTQFRVRQRAHVVEGRGPHGRKQLLHCPIVEPEFDVEQNRDQCVGHGRGQQPSGQLKRVRHSLEAARFAELHHVAEEGHGKV